MIVAYGIAFTPLPKGRSLVLDKTDLACGVGLNSMPFDEYIMRRSFCGVARGNTAMSNNPTGGSLPSRCLAMHRLERAGAASRRRNRRLALKT